MNIGIIGGGLTGLTIAAHLKHNFEVLEKNKECGGLCRSFKEDGFTFDIGGHIFFSRNTELFNEVIALLEDNKTDGLRNNKIFFKGRFVKYPFENGLSELPKEDNFECIYHYISNPFSKKKPTNFKEWIYHIFGKGIAEKYLIPYNEKIWNFDSSKMSLHWMEGRVPRPPIEDVLKSAIGISTEGYKEQLNFKYPKTGGISTIISALQNKIVGKGEIVKEFKVQKIKKDGDKWLVSDGKTEKQYDKIISTMPINELIDSLDDVPQNIKDTANNLKYNSLILIMIGLNEKSKDYSAIYFPEKNTIYHRVCFMNTFSKFNSPEGKSAVIAEITFNKGDDISKMSEEEIIKHVVDSLDKEGIINKNNVVHSKTLRFKYAYVVYDLDYQENIKLISSHINDRGIEICGRFGQFEYLNMDACFEKAKEMAQKINSSS